jgi:hypothetical protein
VQRQDALPADLAKVVAAWPDLSQDQKAKILAVIEAE